MARRVFFSFHWADIQRANVVRKAQTVRAAGDEAGFYDASLWEEARTRGPAAIKRLIDEGLKGSSVTAVLIGSETARRPWVRYEIEQSYNLSRGLLGIHINSIRDWSTQQTRTPGLNPFDWIAVGEGSSRPSCRRAFPSSTGSETTGTGTRAAGSTRQPRARDAELIPLDSRGSVGETAGAPRSRRVAHPPSL